MISSKRLYKKALIWRYRHISERQFIYILSVLTGFLAGLGTLAFKNLTYFFHWVLETKLIREYHHSLYFVFPIIGLVFVYLIKKYIVKKPIGHGISTTLYAISKQNGIIEKYKMFASLITAPITVGFGGSAGLQGPAVSTGAALGSRLAIFFHMNAKTRMLLIGCATAGAMASMFKAPIAAIIFAVEIFSLDLAFASLMPLLLASISAVVTSYFFIGQHVLFRFNLQDVFAIEDIIFYIVLGIGTGFASVYFTRIYYRITNFFDKYDPVQKLIIGGIAIGTILFLIPPLFGEGYGIINNLLAGNHVEAIGKTPFNIDVDNIYIIIILLIGIVVFKAIAMTITFSAGGVGGVFIPTLVMGSAFGNVIAKILNLTGLNVSETNFTLLGMCGLMAGVLHAPLTAMFLIAEITGGYELFVPLMLVSGISYAITKYFISHSIYTRELAEKGILITHNKDKNALMLLDIKKVIETDFVKLTPDMSLKKMLKKKVVKSDRNLFPVVKKDDTFIGIVSMGDIRGVMFNRKLYNTTAVRDYLHPAPEVIFYDDCAEVIMKKFKESRAWNLPVLKDGKYIGFISKSKLLSVYRAKLLEVTS